MCETEEKKQNLVYLNAQNIENETVKNLKRKRIQIQEKQDTEFIIDEQNTLKGTCIDANKKVATVILIFFHRLISFKIRKKTSLL